VIILIGGPSGAGKSEIAKYLVEKFDATYVQMDNFYNTFEEMKAMKLQNWDHPDAFNWRRFEDFLTQLDSKDEFLIPIYHKEPGVIKGTLSVPKKDVLVIDGMYALTNNFKIQNDTVLKIYVHADRELRRNRKIKRDMKLGRSREQVERYFDEQTSVMEVNYVFPTRNQEDVCIVENNGHGIEAAAKEAYEVVQNYSILA